MSLRTRWISCCDQGHHWTIVSPDRPTGRKCPFGYDAVTVSKQTAVDQCAITFYPGAAVVDEVVGQIAYEGTYHLVLSDRDGVELRVSTKAYSFADACRFAERYLGRPRERSLLLWDRSPP